jgi:hypothetical protein
MNHPNSGRWVAYAWHKATKTITNGLASWASDREADAIAYVERQKRVSSSHEGFGYSWEPRKVNRS